MSHLGDIISALLLLTQRHRYFAMEKPAELQPEFLARRASLKRVVREDAPVSAPEPPIAREAIGGGAAPTRMRPAPSLDEMEAEVARERGEARLRGLSDTFGA